MSCEIDIRWFLRRFALYDWLFLQVRAYSNEPQLTWRQHETKKKTRSQEQVENSQREELDRSYRERNN